MEDLNSLCCIILNFNTLELTINLARLIESYGQNIRICIVDNCSTDNSLEVLKKSYFTENTLVVSSKKNGGYSYGNNYGYSCAKKKWSDLKYICILNPDVWIDDKYCFSKLIKILEENERIAMVKPTMLNNGKTVKLKDSAWKLPTKTQRIFSHTIFDPYNKPDKYHGVIKNDLYFSDVLSGSFFIIRDSVFNSIGGFDENVFLYCEESILALRIKHLNKNWLSVVDLNTYYDHRHKHQNISNYSKKNTVAVNTFRSFKYMFENYYSPNKLDIFLFNLIQRLWLEKVKIQTMIKYDFTCIYKLLNK